MRSILPFMFSLMHCAIQV